MADAATQFVLLEAAAGYALFEVVAFEEIGALLEGNKDTVVDLGRFKRAVKLVAFQPFESAADALENANAISEHAMTETLRTFLEGNLPAIPKKKKKSSGPPEFSLGVIDAGLATAIADGLAGISCRSDDFVRELCRGCRLHLSHYIRGMESGSAAILQAQLGLGHSYSRSKVKFNPARSDNMIIQSIALLDQMDKDLNTFAMRIREWYSWHFPELKDIVKDNYMFARCAALIQDKTTLSNTAEAKSGDGDEMEEDDDEEDEEDDKENGNSKKSKVDKFEGLVTITGDRDTANAVLAAAKTSMGVHCSAVDMVNIVNFTQRMIKLAEFRKQLSNYLQDKMKIVAPNLAALIGDTVAARLISKAGSLTNLAKSPASTVQILGAEKALFRALKTKGNTPKYGLIYHSTFIGRADSKNKGRISRYLANKCSLATRIDSFSDEPTAAYGEMLREQVEERLKFYETGASPRKNADVMSAVAKRLREEADLVAEQEDGKKKDKKKKDDDDEEMEEDGDEEEETPKKKKKKDKKKKRKSKGDDDDEEDETMKEEKDEDADDTPKKKKKQKKKRKSMDGDEEEDDDDDNEDARPKSAKKAKKQKKSEDDEEDAPLSDKKKKKKDKKKKKKSLE